jgi:hypothetical protein
MTAQTAAAPKAASKFVGLGTILVDQGRLAAAVPIACGLV